MSAARASAPPLEGFCCGAAPRRAAARALLRGERPAQVAPAEALPAGGLLEVLRVVPRHEPPSAAQQRRGGQSMCSSQRRRGRAAACRAQRAGDKRACVSAHGRAARLTGAACCAAATAAARVSAVARQRAGRGAPPARGAGGGERDRCVCALQLSGPVRDLRHSWLTTQRNESPLFPLARGACARARGAAARTHARCVESRSTARVAVAPVHKITTMT